MNKNEFAALGSYKYTTLGQLKIYSRTNRASFFLPDAQRNALMFILDRTIGWGRVWERISPSEFIKGVKRRRGQRAITVVHGTRLAPDDLNEALISLKNIGAIEALDIGGSKYYKISEEWSPAELNGLNMWEVEECDREYYEAAGD